MKFLLLSLLIFPVLGQAIPTTCKQVVVAKTASWKSSHADLYLYQRTGEQWTLADGPIKARLGRTGSAWGVGLHNTPTDAPLKKEGDKRSPAGIFKIGGAWGNATTIRKHPALPYRKVTPQDLWVEDSKSPNYNRHRIIGHLPKTAWEKKQQMKQNDYAHSLKLFIAHNPPPNAKPYAGSAIFFHIWRGGGSKPTAGCTTLSEANLKKLIAWIDPTKDPLYVLLPTTEYEARKTTWKLP